MTDIPSNLDAINTNTAATAASMASLTASVGGAGVDIANTLVVTAALYATGNAVAGKQSLLNAGRVAGGSGMVQSVRLTFKAGTILTPFDVFLFNDDPATSTFTDKTAAVMHANDVQKIAGVVHLSDVTQVGAFSVFTANGLAIPFKLPLTTTLYAGIIVRGAPTFSAVGDAALLVGIIQN